MSSEMLRERKTVISPLGAPLRGVCRVPGDKSISHRAVLFAAMAKGVSRLSGVLDSEDVKSSIRAVQALGAQAHLDKQPDGSLAGTIEGWGANGPVQPAEPIDCGNSGTTARLLMGVLAPWDVRVALTGDDSLRARPMRRIAAPLEQMGVRFEPEGATTLPLTVCGTSNLKPVRYDAPVASAQLKTAVLLAGVYASGSTAVTEPAPSRNHTELMLPSFGVPVEASSCYACVTGPCAPKAFDVAVPGDPSSAAFAACAATLVPGSDIAIEQVSLNAARIGFVRVLARMGARIELRYDGMGGAGCAGDVAGVGLSGDDEQRRVPSATSEGEDPCGTLLVRFAGELHGCEVQAEEIASLVDEIPVLAFVAAHAKGTTVFREVGELRVKETDRLAAIVDGLGRMGVRAWACGDDLHVEGCPGVSVPSGTIFDSAGDHRLAMTWALAGLCGDVPVTVENFESVKISYPDFLSDMQRLAK